MGAQALHCFNLGSLVFLKSSGTWCSTFGIRVSECSPRFSTEFSSPPYPLSLTDSWTASFTLLCRNSPHFIFWDFNQISWPCHEAFDSSHCKLKKWKKKSMGPRKRQFKMYALLVADLTSSIPSPHLLPWEVSHVIAEYRIRNKPWTQPVVGLFPTENKI